MRHFARAFAAAAVCVLLGAAAARAADLNRPPFIRVPSGPIEPGGLDLTNPCILHPESCLPPEPEPDPCIENPEICQPDPPPPCDPTIEVCDPVEEPIADPVDLTPIEFLGGAKVKADGKKFVASTNITLSFDTTALTFFILSDGEIALAGNLAPKGTTGRKFLLFLDDASSDAFAANFAEGGGQVAGRAAGNVLGQSTRMVLTLNEGAPMTLKIRSEVLTSGVGTVVVKASFASVADQ
jgi:hypothetical protein